MAAELATLMWSLVRAISACHPGLDLPHMQRSHCNTLYILLSIPSSKATVKPNLEMLIGCDEGAGLACQTVEDVNREIMVFICFHMFSSRSSLAMSTSSMQNQVHSGSFRFIQPFTRRTPGSLGSELEAGRLCSSETRSRLGSLKLLRPRAWQRPRACFGGRSAKISTHWRREP